MVRYDLIPILKYKNMKIYNGILKILDSAKGTLSLLVLIFSTIAVVMGRIDGISYAAIMGTISAIFMWTRQKTDIADLEHRTAVAATDAKLEVANINSTTILSQHLSNKAVSQVDENTSKIKENTAQIQENNAQVKENVYQVKENISQVKRNISKVEESTSQVKETASKVKEQEATIEVHEVKIEDHAEEIDQLKSVIKK